jgi:DNA transformation protein
MSNKEGYLEWVLEQLSGAGPISPRRMFGGTGLYRDDVFFAIISKDVLYFKVGDANRAGYETRGMAQFRPFADKPHLSMSYYELPADVLEDPDEAAHWVRQAVTAALATKKPPPRPKREAAAKRLKQAKQLKPEAPSQSQRSSLPKRPKSPQRPRPAKRTTRP